MFRRLLAVSLAASFAAGCGLSATGPTSSDSAGGALPAWLFVWPGGHLVRPAPGTYGVYFFPEIAGDPELSAHMEQVLAAASDMTRQGIRFTRSADQSAPISFKIDPADPLAVNHSGWGTLYVREDFRCVRLTAGLRNRDIVLTNVPLHELGHFLFGPGHSDTPGDVMAGGGPGGRMSFSPHEYELWRSSQQFLPGTVR